MKLFKLICAATRDALWAPLLVLVFRHLAVKWGVRAQLDHQIHFLGGFAIAYFLYRVIRMASPFIGTLSPAARYLLTFTSACSVAVFWEFGEFASDIFLGTHIQYKISETLYDLIFGVLGAGVLNLLIVLVTFLKKRFPLSQEV